MTRQQPSNLSKNRNRHLSLVSESTQGRVSKNGDDMDDDALISYWLSELRASGYRPRTVDSVNWGLRALLRRSEKTSLTMTRQDLIIDIGRDGISNSTRQHHKSLYSLYWTWLQDEGYRLDNPAIRLPKVKVVKAEANPVETADLQLLINSGIYSKTRMYVLLYAYQGFRAVEIAAVAGETIDWNNQRILSRDGKGGKEVWRPIHPIVWTEAQKYPRSGVWFPSPDKPGEHVSARNVSTVLSRAMKRAGIVGHRPHNLRAWYATEQSKAGVAGPVIAAGMRHADMQSLPRYLAVPMDQIAAAQDALPVIAVPQSVHRESHGPRGPYKTKKKLAEAHTRGDEMSPLPSAA